MSLAPQCLWILLLTVDAIRSAYDTHAISDRDCLLLRSRLARLGTMDAFPRIVDGLEAAAVRDAIDAGHSPDDEAVKAIRVYFDLVKRADSATEYSGAWKAVREAGKELQLHAGEDLARKVWVSPQVLNRLRAIEVEWQALLWQLGITAYHEIHHEWPTGPDEVVAAGLGNLAADRVSGHGLVFQFTPSNIRFYSFGADGIDNRGTEPSGVDCAAMALQNAPDWRGTDRVWLIRRPRSK